MKDLSTTIGMTRRMRSTTNDRKGGRRSLILLLLPLAMGCADQEARNDRHEATQDHHKTHEAMHKMSVSLTFQEYNAEEAMRFYVDVFDEARIIDIQRWGAEGPGKEGTIMAASFELNGMRFICSDSPPVHDWTFSPAVAVHVDVADEAEVERLYTRFSEKGTVAMPLDNYGFSRKFAWVVDQFGVSWQLNLK